jgi:hypothetical protein
MSSNDASDSSFFVYDVWIHELNLQFSNYKLFVNSCEILKLIFDK